MGLQPSFLSLSLLILSLAHLLDSTCSCTSRQLGLLEQTVLPQGVRPAGTDKHLRSGRPDIKAAHLPHTPPNADPRAPFPLPEVITTITSQHRRVCLKKKVTTQQSSLPKFKVYRRVAFPLTMVRGKGYLRLCHCRNQRQRLDLKQEQLPQQNNAARANGGERRVSPHLRLLCRSFRMLSVQRPEAPPVAAMQDLDDIQDDDQGFSLHVDDETKSQCRISVSLALPDIDPEYLARVCTEAQWDPNRVIDQILDQMENGNPYPRMPKPNLLKRKRDDEEEPPAQGNAAAKFDNEERRRQLKANSYKKTW